MWQVFLWVSAIVVAFGIWDSLSRSNAKLESLQQVVPKPVRTDDNRAASGNPRSSSSP